MTEGLRRLKQIREYESIEMREKELKLSKDTKMHEYIIYKICPKCGKDLIDIEECGTYSISLYSRIEFYIECSCGFKYYSIGHKKEDTEKFKNQFRETKINYKNGFKKEIKIMKIFKIIINKIKEIL